MVAFSLGIILGVLGGFLLLALFSELSRFFLAHKGKKNSIHTESFILAAADSYYETSLPAKSSPHR